MFGRHATVEGPRPGDQMISIILKQEFEHPQQR